MRSLCILFVHLLTTLAKLLGAGGIRSVVAETLLLKQQLLIVNRAQRRAPALSSIDRLCLGLLSLFVQRRRLHRAAVVIKPSTLLRLHAALVKRKYHLLFANGGGRRQRGPEGPSRQIISAVVEIKQRNPRFGCPRIAAMIATTFDIVINKDVVRRILAKHYRPDPSLGNGPSWLSFIGHTKDSLWSVDLFRCESMLLKSHWVLVVLDQFTRRLIGVAVHAGNVEGRTLCRLFARAIAGAGTPAILSSDNDPLFEFARWRATLRILGIESIKSVPYTPISHPFVERLIGTVRREYLDQVFFWNASDLEKKLNTFKDYYNRYRVHQALGGRTPHDIADPKPPIHARLDNYGWQHHCRGLFQTPVAV